MSLFKSFSPAQGIHTVLWKTEETLDELLSMVEIHPSDEEKMRNLNNPEKVKEFLALRCCLKEYFGTNPEVFYRSNGKPYLGNGYEVSFSHTRGYAAAIFSDNLKVGIDLETHRETIRKIAPKFMSEEEFRSLHPECEIQQIIYYWGAKEVIVKIEGDRKLNFIRQIKIKPIVKSCLTSTEGTLLLDNKTKHYLLFFECFSSLYLSYGWELGRK